MAKSPTIQRDNIAKVLKLVKKDPSIDIYCDAMDIYEAGQAGELGKKKLVTEMIWKLIGR